MKIVDSEELQNLLQLELGEPIDSEAIGKLFQLCLNTWQIDWVVAYYKDNLIENCTKRVELFWDPEKTLVISSFVEPYEEYDENVVPSKLQDYIVWSQVGSSICFMLDDIDLDRLVYLMKKTKQNKAFL